MPNFRINLSRFKELIEVRLQSVTPVTRKPPTSALQYLAGKRMKDNIFYSDKDRERFNLLRERRNNRAKDLKDREVISAGKAPIVDKIKRINSFAKRLAQREAIRDRLKELRDNLKVESDSEISGLLRKNKKENLSDTDKELLYRKVARSGKLNPLPQTDHSNKPLNPSQRIAILHPSFHSHQNLMKSDKEIYRSPIDRSRLKLLKDRSNKRDAELYFRHHKQHLDPIPSDTIAHERKKAERLDIRNKLKKLNFAKRLGFMRDPEEIGESDEENRKLERNLSKLSDSDKLKILYNKKRLGELEPRKQTFHPITKETPEYVSSNRFTKLMTKRLDPMVEPINKRLAKELINRDTEDTTKNVARRIDFDRMLHWAKDDQSWIRSNPHGNARKYVKDYVEGFKNRLAARKRLRVLSAAKRLGLSDISDKDLEALSGSKISESDEDFRKLERKYKSGETLSDREKLAIIKGKERSGQLEPIKRKFPRLTDKPKPNRSSSYIEGERIRDNYLRKLAKFHKWGDKSDIDNLRSGLLAWRKNINNAMLMHREGTIPKQFSKIYALRRQNIKNIRKGLKILNLAKKMGLNNIDRQEFEKLNRLDI